MTNQDTHLPGSLWLRRLPVLLLFVALFFTLLPSWNLGFVSDDYGHLVEAARLPITSSTDGLHRPLRNIFFRLGSAAFGLNPAPYHLVMILLHLTLVALLYRFVLLLNHGKTAAFITVALFGFFPRSHQSLFWVAAAQDTVVAICTLIACFSLLQFRRRGRLTDYFLALVAFLIALGFKETAIAIFPLLLLLEVTIARRESTAKPGIPWRVYLPFLIVTGLYLSWVFGPRLFGWAGEAQNYYAVQSLSQSIKLAVKFVINMLLPFSGPVEARELLSRPLLGFVVVIEVLAMAAAGLVLVRRREMLLSVGWIAIGMAPTAVFGLYTDRYLLMPFMGLALLVGFIVEASMARLRAKELAVQGVLVALVCLYLFAAIPSLLGYESNWREAAREVQATVAQARKLHPQVPSGSVLSFVNLTHSRNNGQIYVFNTSLNGALAAGGFDHVIGQRTFSTENSHEEQLVKSLLSCSTSDPAHAAAGTYVFVYIHGLIDVSGDCGNQVVEISRVKDPELWK